MSTMIDQFRRAIEQAGLSAPGEIVPDGAWHRFASNGEREDDAGWYRFFPDGVPAGSFGCWRSGLTQTWCAKTDIQMTATERNEHRQRLDAVRREREQEEQRRHAEAAAWAQQLWEQATPASVLHHYLQKKQVQPHGLKLYRETVLLVPVMIGHTLTSLELIDENGDKKFLPGGAVKGGSYTIGDLTEAKTIVICEGYATGASLHEATGHPTVCAFFANNLMLVAQQLRQQFQTAVIVVAGDNDVHDDGAVNTGLLAATAAAAAADGLVAIPEAINNSKTDWNDIHVQQGREAVKEAIEAVLTREEAATDQTSHDQPHHAGEQGLVKELSDDILRTDHFAKDAGGQLYVFDGGCYRPHGEAHVLREVKRLLEVNGDTKRWSTHRAREVAEYIRVDTAALWERPPANTLNLTNGLLNVTTGMLAQHAPSHLSPVQLPVTFDPSATCPRWESFLTRVLPEDCQRLPYELVAASMRGTVSDQQAVLLVGAGENGKSTLLDAIVAFLGKKNVSSLALQRLECDKFSVVRLLGKLANVCADLPSDHLTSTSTFKALTGGDQLTAERKFQESFEFTPFARLLFSTNHYPQSKDASHAFFRRWLVLPFEIVIEPAERIDHLAGQLADSRELSGVLNQALAVLPKMISQGGFSQNETTRTAAMEFREMTDPLAAWLDRCTVVSPDGLVTRKDLLILYNAACETADRPPMTSKAFCAAVRRLRPAVTEKQRIVRGSMQWVFLGLGVRAPSSPSASSATPDGLFAEEIVHDES